MEKVKAAAKAAWPWFLKSFRGLIAEKKDGEWEMSKGAAMSWVLLAECVRLSFADKLSPEMVLGAWAMTMGYNGLKMVDIGGAVSKLRGRG